MFSRYRVLSAFVIFFFHESATTEFYTLSLHDALPIWSCCAGENGCRRAECGQELRGSSEAIRWIGGDRPLHDRLEMGRDLGDRKSTRLNPVTSRSRMPSSA